MSKGSNIIEFIPKTAFPPAKTVIYARVVCDYRPLKSEPNRTRLKVGGDRLTCDHKTSTDEPDLILIKLFLIVYYQLKMQNSRQQISNAIYSVCIS